MGWRAWNHFEESAEEARRRLPVRERYTLCGFVALALMIALTGTYFWAKLQ